NFISFVKLPDLDENPHVYTVDWKKDKIDFIIHAASQASPKYYGIDPVGTLKANVVGTINLLELARKKKIESFLYFSSGEVYGILTEDKIPINENSYGYVNPCDVRSCYAEGKRMGENICVSYFHQYKIPIKIVRPFHTYGPGMQLDDGRVYADFVRNILQNEPIQLQSDGSAKRAFCYLTDATIGFIKILLDGINGEAYNVGNPNEEKSILELAKILVNLPQNNNTQIKYLSTKNDNNYMKSPIQRNSPKIDKINILGWFPKISVEEGFSRTIKSFKQ
ncbi:MAG: NAD-dependent epimerase/dehydratase family protein, partial [Sediminibacterium sp.]|nr:NAD-dependent epimerase/dehydratase family protein [Sediminibacterium sp.]